MAAAGPLYITGFGAFPGVDDNPTESLVRGLDGRVFGGRSVHAEVLPVSFLRAPGIVADAVAERSPAAVIHFGVAANANTIRVETSAYNTRRSAQADVDGKRYFDAPIRPEVPEGARRTTGVPVEEVVAGIRAVGVPAAHSDDPGRYVCNCVYYESLSSLAAGIPCVFIHVPMVGARFGDAADGLVWTSAHLLSAAESILAWFGDFLPCDRGGESP